MKKIIIIALICLPFICRGQDKDANPDKKHIPASDKSNFEKFSELTGTLKRKEYFDLDKIADINFELIRVTNLNTDTVKFGLRLSGLSSTYNNCETYLDQDEFEAFDKTVAYMINNVISSNANVGEVEYNFVSRSFFSFNCYNWLGIFNSKKKWRISCTLDDFGSYSSYTHFDFDPEDLPKIKELLDKVISRVSTMK